LRGDNLPKKEKCGSIERKKRGLREKRYARRKEKFAARREEHFKIIDLPLVRLGLGWKTVKKREGDRTEKAFM